MYKCIEQIMLAEFTVDLLAVAGALRPAYRLRPGRLICAAAFGSLFAGFAAIFPGGAAGKAAAALICSPVIVYIAAGRMPLRSLAGAVCALLVNSAFISLAARLIPCPYFFAAAAAGAGTALLSGRRRWLESWDARIEIATEYGCCSLNGLIDTGNRLREPVSSLPVMVAGSDGISEILPSGFAPDDPLTCLPAGYRLIPYGALGGNGYLGCFMPDSLTVESCGYSRKLRGVWVAVYPGKLPGGHGALLPGGEFTNP